MATPMFRCLSGRIKFQFARWCLEQHVKNGLKYAFAPPEWLACRKANEKAMSAFIGGPLCATSNVNNESRRYLSKVNDGGGRPKRPLRLMAFPELIWPHPLKSLKNMFFAFLIRNYFDDQFYPDTFLKGSEQAISLVSSLISKGSFAELEGLVANDAIPEIQQNYEELSQEQRDFISVDPNDFFFRFIYETGMIFDDKSDKRFVEITAVFQGLHGLNEIRTKNPDTYAHQMQTEQGSIYVCNYRFIREYTKSKEDTWTINKLNHFSPKELVMSSDAFRR